MNYLQIKIFLLLFAEAEEFLLARREKNFKENGAQYGEYRENENPTEITADKHRRSDLDRAERKDAEHSDKHAYHNGRAAFDDFRFASPVEEIEFQIDNQPERYAEQRVCADDYARNDYV